MKKTIYSMAILVLMTFSIGCKKTSTTPPSILGFWSGLATTSSTNSIGFLYNSDGTIRAYSNNADTTLANKYSGTYTVDDSVRTNVVSGILTTVCAAKLNSAGNSMTGVLRNTSGGVLGTYSVSR